MKEPAVDTRAEAGELNEMLSNWLFRWRLIQTTPWAVRGLAAGLACGLAFSIVARFQPLAPVTALVGLSLGFALLGLSLAVGLRWFWPVSRLRAAQFFDRRFNLAERTSTALELAGEGRSMETPEWMVRRQLTDAVDSARRVDPGRYLPWTIGRNDALIAMALVLALAASLYLPNPMEGLWKKRQAVDRAIQEQITQVEAIRRAVEENPSLTQEQKDALQQPLDEALERLNEGQLTPEQAVSVLTSAENELSQLANPEALEQGQGLQETGQNLSQTTSGPMDPVNEDLASGELEQAANDLADLDPSGMTAAEQQALADQLEQAARELASSNPQLAQQLQAAADALRQGDAQAASEALQQAAETMQQTAGQVAQAQAAQQAASGLAQGREQIAQAAQPGEGQGQGAGAVEPIGQGQGQGQGQNEGQGIGMGQGQGAGAGAGQGEGNADAQGGEAGNDPISQDNGPGDGGLRGYEPIYSPYRLGGEGGPEVNLDGSGDPGDEIVGQAETNPGQNGTSTVPYNQVYSLYQDAVTEAINSGQIPISMRPIIRYYFSSLQP